MAIQTPASAPEQHPLTADLGWLLSTAAYALKTQITDALADTGISPRQQHVLMAAGCGAHTQSDLVATIGLDKTTLVTTLDDLERQGLVERRPAPHDRRARMVVVTKAGQQKLEEGQAFVAKVQAEILESLPAKDRAVFLEALSHLVDGRLSERMPGDVCRAPRRPRGG